MASNATTTDASAPGRAHARAEPAGTRAAAVRPSLERPRVCAVSGVSAGLARHLGWPVWLVRASFVALTFAWGAGLLLYVWLWIFVPWASVPWAGARADTDAQSTADADARYERVGDAPTRRVPVAWLLAASALVAVLATVTAIALDAGDGVVGTTMPWWAGGVLLATALAVSAGAWATVVDRRDPARGPRHENIVRIVVTAALLVLLIAQLSLLARTSVAGYALVLVPPVGIALVYAAAVVERWRELAGERVRRIREEQRAEMAAHLHDSVLQSLALIQNRAGASSEAARIARAQERELRAWLYDGDAPADSDLPTDLRDYAAALELDYPVRIDVVSAGLPAERASGEVAAASREAMLNAARHAGGEVSVYIEGNQSAVDVYVRDHGPGFDLDAVPGDRLGIRESIVGRMRRAGGSATVRRGASGGTEVHLRFAAEPTASREPAGEARRG